ncbi:MAG: hypothetical protein ACOYM2_08625 [Rectinemataceae bacterium]
MICTELVAFGKSENAAKPEIRIGGDRPLAGDDVSNALRGNGDLLG